MGARHTLMFRRLSRPYGIVRFEPNAAVPDWATKGEFTSITRTGEELSVVCPTENLPAGVDSPHRWICLKIEGPFPFSQTAVLMSFIQPLSDNGVPIFAISTYDTDYVLVQEGFADAAIAMLQAAGHEYGP